MKKSSVIPIKSNHNATNSLIGEGDPTPTAKVFALLELLSQCGSARLTDLASALGVPKTTLHRIVAQLEQLGYLQREPKSRQLTIAPRLAKLSSGLLGAAVRLAPRHAILEQLSIQLGESCSLAIRVGHHVVYLDDVTASSPLTFNFQAGQRTPLHCTSTGKLFLAYMSKRDLGRFFTSEPLVSYTSNTITEEKKLRSLLRKISKEGIAYSENEFVLGTLGAAVPVLDKQGNMLAALTVSIPAVRMSISELPELQPALTVAAGKLALMFD